MSYKVMDNQFIDLTVSTGGGGSGTGSGARGPRGAKGEKGDPGVAGSVGKSAYQTWLDAGNTGTEGEFIQDLIGIDGQDGIGVQIKGSKTLAEIKAINGKLGDIYISTDAPVGHGWVSDGKTGASSWTDFGMFRGPSGTGGGSGTIHTTTITNVDDIVDTGSYDGTDIIGAPITGKILISAIKDNSGDIQYTIYSADGHLRLGGKPAAGHITWDPVIPLVFKGAGLPNKTIGIDGDNYIQTGDLKTASDVVKPTPGAVYNTLDLTVDANVISAEIGQMK